MMETQVPLDEWESLLATKEWPALKQVWQEMTRHDKRKARDFWAFKKLEPTMQGVFAGLKEQAATGKIQPQILEALQATVEQRYDQIRWSVYPPTCYEATSLGVAVQSSHRRLEKQYDTLARLAEQERIKLEVADKARQLIARQVEFQVQAHRLGGEKPSYQREQRKDELLEAFDRWTHEVKPDFPVSEESQQVARLILELCRS